MPSTFTSFSSRQVSQLRLSLAGITGFLVVGLAVVGLLGWITDTSWLRTFGTEGVSMKVNTALMLLLLGFELVRLGNARQRNAHPGYLLPGLVLTLALLTLAEYAFSLDLGIDQLFFADTGFNPLGTPPGRPSAMACFGFANLATALLLYRWIRWLVASQVLSLFTTVIAFGVLLGHLLGVSQFYMFGNLSAVALHTALGLLMGGIGTAWLYPKQGILKTAASPYWGGIVMRYLGIYVLVAPPLLTLIYETGMTRKLIGPLTGLPFVLFWFVFITALLFYKVAVVLNTLDQKNRQQQEQLNANAEELKTQYDLLASIQNASQTGISALRAMRDETGQIIDFQFTFRNETAIQMTGRPMTKANGQTLLERYPDARTSGILDRYIQVVKTGEPQTFEQFYVANGTEGWFDMRVCRWNDGIVVDINNITAKKQAEQAVQQQAEFYKSVLDNTLASITAFKAVRNSDNAITDFEFILANQAAIQLTGLPESEVIGNQMTKLFPGVIESGQFATSVRILESGEPLQQEVHYNYEGYDVWLWASTKPYGDGLLVSYTDITAQKQAERKNLQQADFYRTVLDNALTSISGFEAVRNETGTITDFRYTLLNKEALRFTGLEQTEVIGKNLTDLFPSVRLSGQFETNVSIVESGEPQQSELHYKDEKNDVWLLSSSMPMGDNLFVSYADITKLKQAELALKQQNDLLERVMDATPTAIVVHETIRNEAGEIIDFRMTRLNEVAAQMMGNPIEKIQHRRISRYFPGILETQLFEQYKRAVETGQLIRVEADVQNRWYDFSAIRFGDGVIVAAQDVTPMRQYRQQLEIANYELKRSNDSLQSFAFIASHDLQEPLRKITSFADVLHTQYAGQFNAGATDIIRRINGSAERMRLLIKDLLEYSRIETHRETAKLVDLTKLIQGLQEEELWAAIHQRKAQIELGDLPTLRADPMQMRQLFQNLLSNAIKFCPTGTVPVIAISSQRINQAGVPDGLLSPAKAGDNKPSGKIFHEISVIDNGIGFDEKYRERIFQIFQRLHSKSQFAGSGIGLAICQKIMERHGGTITANSKPGKGSTFTVYFPV